MDSLIMKSDDFLSGAETFEKFYLIDVGFLDNCVNILDAHFL